MAILRESIPAKEQLPEERLIRLLSGEHYCLYAGRARDDVQAMALVYFSTGSACTLLDYMAVRADLRNKGLGATLFRDIVEISRRHRPAADWLLIEVDDDREGSAEERRVNRRRIEFYRRLGASLLTNVPYRFPSVSGPPVPMRLMVHPLSTSARLSPQNLKGAVEDVFQNVHDRGAGDPVLQWFVSNMPGSLEMK